MTGTAESRSAAGDRNPWLIAIVVSIATFMLVLDSSIANVALVNIAGDLAAGVDEATWIVTTYLVANAVVLPVSGWLASVVGRKRYYMLCVAGFTLSSMLCGLAWNLPSLIFFRVLQGLSGGGMAPSEQSILADTFPPEQRSQAFALYGVAVVVAPTIGPTLGGWLTDNLSWHWIFFINVPFGLLSLGLVQALLVEPEVLRRERRERTGSGLRVDWPGFLLVAASLGCLEVVLDEGQREDWFASPLIVGFTLVSVVSFLLFVPWELSRADPIVEIRLLGRRTFGMAFVVMLAVGALLFGSTQILPQMLQTGFGYTAFLSGLALMPGGVATLVTMPIAGQLARRVQVRYLLAGGMLVIALAMGHLTSLVPDTPFAFFARARVYQMLGLPFLFVPINTAAYAGLPPGKTNQASALVNVARNLGGSVGISLANTELARRTQFHHARLVEHVTAASPAFQHAVRQVTEHFVALGASASSARGLALGWMAQAVQRQATLLAYADVFFGASVFAAVLVPVVLLLLPRIRTGGGPAPVHA